MIVIAGGVCLGIVGAVLLLSFPASFWRDLGYVLAILALLALVVGGIAVFVLAR